MTFIGTLWNTTIYFFIVTIWPNILFDETENKTYQPPLNIRGIFLFGYSDKIFIPITLVVSGLYIVYIVSIGAYVII